MELKKYLLVVSSAFLFLSAAGQQDGGAWGKTITGNAIRKAEGGKYVSAPKGYALYYSMAGQVNEPYLVYVPKGYDVAKPTAVVVFLHGAILARETFQYADPATVEEPVFGVGDKYNTIVLFPFGRSDFKWAGPSPAYENVMQMIAQTGERYNVDKKRIYIGGISMGGIATFWFVNHHPETFAGFYTFSAMPRLAEGPIQFSNITKDKPLYSMNAKDDPGFSYSEVHDIYEQHKNEAPGWHFESVETGGHRFIYGAGGKRYVQEVVGELLKK